MAKGKSQSKKGGFWKKLFIAALLLVVGGAITFGVIKGIDHFKPADKPDTEQTEQIPETPNTDDQTPEEQLATANVDKII